MYPSITKNPSTLLGEFNNGALGFEEEEVLGVGNGQRRVRFLGAVCNFAANGSNENLLEEKLAPITFMIQGMNSSRRNLRSRITQSPPTELSPSLFHSTPCHSSLPSDSAPARQDT